MGSTKKPASGKNSASASHERDVSGIHAQQLKELEDLTLFSQPFKTSKYFLLAVIQHFQRSISYILGHGGWVMLFSIGVVLAGVLLVTIDGPHEKHVEEVLEYVRFGLWWMALGVASSIGLGSGLHTFVLYLGPHIALFTIKAVQCGRVDIKAAPYDTIQLKRVPSWLGKECSGFLPALSPSSLDTHISLSSILPQVQLEAILWGIGTALGELPPYFISRAANSSGSKMDSIQELDDTSEEDDGFLASKLNKIKRWFLSHAQYMNFFTILVLASVPNPLFDLAGIMCGQFGIPFWEFFLATLIGKAIIKTHIQTVFIISVCNNQLLNWIENEFIWVLSFIPGFDSILPGLVAKLHSMKNKYLATKPPAPENVEVNKWDFSIGSIWNTVVWIMLLNFFIKIVNATAQGYLKKEHEERNKSSELVNSDSGYHQTQDAFVD